MSVKRRSGNAPSASAGPVPTSAGAIVRISSSRRSSASSWPARSPPPTSHVRFRPRELDQPHQLGQVAGEDLDRLRARQLRQLLGVRDDPRRLARVRPGAVRDHEVPRPRAHDQRVDIGVEDLVVVLRAGERLQEREVVLVARDPAVEAEGGVVGDHAPYDPRDDRAGEAARDPPRRARRRRRPGRRRLEVHRRDGEEPRVELRGRRARRHDPLLRRERRPLRQAGRDRDGTTGRSCSAFARSRRSRPSCESTSSSSRRRGRAGGGSGTERRLRLAARARAPLHRAVPGARSDRGARRLGRPGRRRPLVGHLVPGGDRVSTRARQLWSLPAEPSEGGGGEPPPPSRPG